MAEPRSQLRKSRSVKRSTSRSSTRPSCEAALQAIAHGCATELRRQSRAAAGGHAVALHRIRIALTRLRTAIRFFAPAVDDAAWKALQQEAAWLSRTSGLARDIDVALQRDRHNGAAHRNLKQWRAQRNRMYARLRRALQSVRYRRFIDALTRQGRLSRVAGHDQSVFSSRRIDRWQRKLLDRGRKLDGLGARKRHRLRLRAKRFRYALEWSLPLLKNERAILRKQIAQATLIQSALGRLNDASTHRAQAAELGIDPLPFVVRLERKRSRQRLLRAAREAFDELRQLRLS